MADNHVRGVPSTAAIAGHPIHPMLIPFPIALLTGALATDLAYWWTDEHVWARASIWLVGTGLVMGALAAVFGATDFLTIRRAREHMAGRIHLGLAALYTVNLLLRGGRKPPTGAVPVLLSLLGTAGLLVSTWYGGHLSYDHGMRLKGVSPVADVPELNLGGRWFVKLANRLEGAAPTEEPHE